MIVSFLNEASFILSTTETYATYSGSRTSAATAKVIDYETKSLIIKDVDLGRAEQRKCAAIIELNDAWIAEEAVGRMKAEFPDFIMPGDDPANNSYGGTNYCLRDTKDYIIGAVIKDLKEGGTYHPVYCSHISGSIRQTEARWWRDSANSLYMGYCRRYHQRCLDFHQ